MATDENVILVVSLLQNRIQALFLLASSQSLTSNHRPPEEDNKIHLVFLQKRDTEEEQEMWEVIAWLLFFFVIISLLVVVVYQLMCFADLEFDYSNPYDCASRINCVILPEFITQAILCSLYLLTGHWIFNQLNREKKQRLFKLGYLIMLLFITLFWMIFNALEDDEI
ncbi:Cornichon [Cynara cardunculus var. scolymus]|uniref:Cornichon n=1 Tax=Cynara cardunculus var. scolymus TaxID=59895 RepID=A0A103XRD4_CYNCS|nr:Cornichon [Cynara cardunculus var. scolymus]